MITLGCYFCITYSVVVKCHTFKPHLVSVSQVYELGGIPALVTLLRSPNPKVSQAAAGSLRNLVFKDLNNKREVQHCSGIAKALQLLKETDSSETQKQIAGDLMGVKHPTYALFEKISSTLSRKMCSTRLCVLIFIILVKYKGCKVNT